MRSTLPAAAVLAALAVPASAGAAPAVLPAVERQLSSAAPSADCATTATTTYRAPIAGFLDVRLRDAAGDWDLGLRDAASKQSLGSSRSFGSDEVLQTWVQAGQRVLVQGCRRPGASPTATVSLQLVDVAPPKAGSFASRLIRVRAAGEEVEQLEATGIDITHNVHQGYADVVVHSAKDLKAVRSLGLSFRTVIADLAKHARKSRLADVKALRRGRSALPSGRTTYRTWPEIQQELKDLVAANPDTVRPVVIGKTVQGRDIEGIEIAKDVKADDGRPTYFVHGVHHAREWAAAEAPMEFAQVLAKEGGSDARVAKLLATTRTVIVPVINVDGYITSRNAEPYDPFMAARDTIGDDPLGTGLPLTTVASILPPGGVFTYRRKNCNGAVPSPAFPCELQYGHDNNRNYGNLWGGPGSSSDVTSQSYHGPGPRSEPETQAVWDFTRKNHVTTLLTMHNVAALVLRPPGIREQGFAPDEARMKEIGDAMAAATNYESQYGFQLYDTTGTTDDDTYTATGGYGYTVEIGPKDGEFHAPYQVGFVEQWDGTYAKKPGQGLRELFLIAGEAAARNEDHAILAGTATPGTTLRLKKQFDTVTSEWCDKGVEPVLTVSTPLSEPLYCPAGRQPAITLKDELDATTKVPASGKFEWHINQSTRPFVGGGAVKETYGTIPGSEQVQEGAPGAINDKVDHEFTVPAGAEAAQFDLTPSLPEDYDIEVFQVQGDGSLKSVGTSGNLPGESEQVVVSPAAPGKYVVRVTYYAALSGQYEVKAVGSKTTREVTTGTKESYTLTCERDGQVVETRTLTIDRGQGVALQLCGGAPVAAAGRVTGATPAVDGVPVANTAAGTAAAAPKPVVKKPAAKKKKAKRKLTAKQKRALARKKAAAKRRAVARCKAKAKRIKSPSKRRAALRRCS